MSPNRGAAGRLHRRHVRIGAGGDEQLHRVDVARVGGAPERRGADLVHARQVEAVAGYQTFFFSRALTSAPLSISAFISSRYAELLLHVRLRLRVERLRRPFDVEHGVERRHALRRWREFGSAPWSSSVFARSKWPLMIAISSGLVLSPGDGWLTSAPASSSAAVDSWKPWRTGIQQRRQAAVGDDQLVER